MKKNIEAFLEEYSENFSELFVETFFIRYLNDFNSKDILKDIQNLKSILNKKIDIKFSKKIEELIN